MSTKIDFFRIPVFIISYNRLLYLTKIIEWLEKAGYTNLNIVDNNSTYPPLLEYLKKSPHHVYMLDKNFGHLVVWECGRFDLTLNNEFYVVSDCDIIPTEECPKNAVEYFFHVLEKYENFTKVGFALKIDDLPDCYIMKEKVIEWEKQFWQTKIEEDLYEAAIDTTFALYKPGVFPKEARWWRSIRTDYPFLARHLPWYQDSNNLSEEEHNYQRNLKEMSTHWSLTDPLALKEQNVKLQFEIHKLRSEIQVIKNDFWLIKKDVWSYFLKPYRDFIRVVMPYLSQIKRAIMPQNRK
jgi:hypothetical protein